MGLGQVRPNPISVDLTYSYPCVCIYIHTHIHTRTLALSCSTKSLHLHVKRQLFRISLFLPYTIHGIWSLHLTLLLLLLSSLQQTPFIFCVIFYIYYFTLICPNIKVMCVNFGFVPHIFVSFCFLLLINGIFFVCQLMDFFLFCQLMDLFVAYKNMQFIIIPLDSIILDENKIKT